MSSHSVHHITVSSLLINPSYISILHHFTWVDILLYIFITFLHMYIIISYIELMLSRCREVFRKSGSNWQSKKKDTRKHQRGTIRLRKMGEKIKFFYSNSSNQYLHHIEVPYRLFSLITRRKHKSILENIQSIILKISDTFFQDNLSNCFVSLSEFEISCFGPKGVQ